MDGRLTRHARILAGFAILAGLAACGGGDSPAPPPPPIAPADTSAPSVPAGLTATAVSATRVDLQWTAATDTGGSGLAGYRVLRGGTQVAQLGATVTTYSDTTVVAATQYSYTVRAFDAATPANVSADSTTATATTPGVATPDTTAPSVPGGVTATAVGPTRVDLRWNASTDTGGSGLAGYRVLRGGTQVAQLGATVTAYSDTTVVAATQYSYTVRAFDAATPANVSGDSTAATVTTPAATASGLDARPQNTSCVAPARPTPATGLQLVRAFPNLTFSSPVGMIQAPGSTARWFVTQQGGTIRAFANDAAVQAAQVTTFLDITGRIATGGERGLLGFAFHPQWPAVPQAFVYYTTLTGGNRLIVSRFSSTDGGQTLNNATEQPLLTMTKNQTDSNHNGGHLAFGPDGLLYVGTGDGGGGGDPMNNAQNLNNLFGKMLRIDVGTATGYTIPAGNRWAANGRCGGSGTGAAPCAEIYAYGLRNPWKWSFDRQTGQLWLGDVGQNAREEVNVVTNGANYGWRFREGGLCFNPGTNCPTTAPNNDPLVGPVVDYGRDAGASITGGFVYRGTRLASLVGRYLFADFATGRVFAHTPGTPFRTLVAADSIATASQPSAFAEAPDGELFVLGYGNGFVYSLQPASGGTDLIPTSLVDTGCVDRTQPTQPSSGLIPYAPNAPFWSDGTAKQRWMGLPAAAPNTISAAADGDWTFPNGTVLVKNFRLGNQLIETRLFMRHPDGEWAGYTYEWNDAQTAATRVSAGKTRVVAGQTWVYPSEQQCLQCHTAAAGRSLGLETAQLNGSFGYPQTGRTANQVTTLNAIGVLSPALTGTLPAYPDPYGTAGTVAERARAYLHTNCSQCHRPNGGTPSTMDLRWQATLAQTNTCDVVPSGATLGIANARLIAPGEPDRSLLLARTNRRDSSAMPPIGSTVVDAQGVALLRQWIQGLTACQ
jgi:uncharacterized repeat protein (TIGR03806 family)